ncbi:MAG TPA: LptF/LptG family permease [Armatimonadota bacterium]|nr:LptF/LptG family permease [Armatimonadota bacterium]
MKILDKFLGKELIGPFLFGVAAFTSIFFAGQYLLKLTSQVLQGTPVLTAAVMLVLYLPSVVVYTLPMSALLAVLIAFSKLSGDSEIVAMYASGVSLYRAIVPVLVLGLIVTFMGFVLSEVVVPAAARKTQAIQAHILKEEISTDKPFVVIDKDTNSTIYVRGGFSARTKVMKDVTITRYNDNEPAMLFQAREARWQGENKWGMNSWGLYDGKMYALGDDPQSSLSLTFEGLSSEPIEIKKSPNDIVLHQRKPEDMTYRELRSHIKALGNGGVRPEELLELEVELYNKFAIPLAALVFALIGAPLAVKPARASTSLGLGLSILIIFAYWFMWHFTTALAIQGGISPFAGAFMADVFGLMLAGILLSRTAK